jgi:hypothetical protein
VTQFQSICYLSLCHDSALDSGDEIDFVFPAFTSRPTSLQEASIKFISPRNMVAPSYTPRHYVPLAFASAVILRSESRGTQDHILLPHIRDSPTWSKLLYDWRFTVNQFVLAPSPLRLTARIFSIEHLRS